MANEDKRIIELPASESILNDDWIAKDSASQDTTRLQLSFLKQLCGGNNFAGEWHSGTTYSKDSYVTREGKLYHNITGSATSTTWKASQWLEVDVGSEIRKIIGSIAPTFDSSTNYDVDDLVTFNNGLCRCISPHSAGAWNSSHFADVNVSSLLTSFIMDNFTDRRWVKYSGSIVNYTKGTVIHKGLSMYRCKANTTNQSWDSSKWEQVDVTDLINSVTVLIETVLSNIAPTFSSSAQYSINDFVLYNNQLYICMKPHHGSWDPLDFGTGKIGDMLKGIFNNIADVYNPSGSYVKGDVVNYVGIPLRCIVDTATSPMVFSEWEQVTVAQLIDEKVADVQIAGQTTTDENHISDLTSLAIEGTASGEIASFSDGSNLPMRSFICNIDAVQDLHGYDYPWVGGSGKNLFDFEGWLQSNNVEYTKTGNSFTFSTMSGALFSNPFSFSTENIDINFNVSVTLGTATNLGFVFLDKDGTVISRRISSKTTVQGVSKVRMDWSASGTVTITEPIISINDVPFEPYSNICPISGWDEVNVGVSGVNVWDEEWELGGYSATTGNKTSSTSSIRAKNKIAIVPNTSYYCSFTTGAMNAICFYDKSGTFIADSAIGISGKSVITTPNNAYFMAFQMSAVYGTTYNNDISINYPSTDTDYHAYNGHTYNIDLGSTCYGGTLDVVSGVMTVDRVEAIYDGSSDENWIYTSSLNRVYINIPNAKRGTLGSILPIQSNLLHYSQGYREDYGAHINDQGNLIVLAPNNITDANAWKTWLVSNNVQVVYELATPLTIQLTPTQVNSLLGVNNVWCSTGDVNVKYNKDATIAYENTVHYTTDEQVIGTWIDGKPIYQKTITISSLNYTTTGVNKVVDTITNIDMVVELKGVLSNSAKTVRRMLPYVNPINTAKTAQIYYDYNATNIIFNSSDMWATAQLDVTIQYTKTTD